MGLFRSGTSGIACLTIYNSALHSHELDSEQVATVLVSCCTGRKMLSKLAPRLLPCLFFALIVILASFTFLKQRAATSSSHILSNLRLPSTSHTANSNHARFAFVTFQAQYPGPNGPVPDDEDSYYIGTRTLVYQLRHSPETRINSFIDLIVLATPDVSQSKRERLEKDGATVLTVSVPKNDWATTDKPRWRDALAKLRVFELTQYEKILMIDSDMLLVKRLDGIFDDEATNLLKPLADSSTADEGHLPAEYMLAAQTIQNQRVHPYPPEYGSYFSSGFFLLKPSHEIFDYYVSLMSLPGRFDPQIMDQNLLNYAHRRDGPMPWTEMTYTWTTTWPTEKEYEMGAASLHEKWWRDDMPDLSTKLRGMLLKERWEMEGFYRGREEA